MIYRFLDGSKVLYRNSYVKDLVSYIVDLIWSEQTLPGSYCLRGVAYGANIFVAVGYGNDNSATDKYLTSPDGINWTERTLPFSSFWPYIYFINNQFVTNTINTSTYLTSPDGITWTTRQFPATTTWGKLAYGNGIYMITSLINNTAYKSTNCIDWTPITLPATCAQLVFNNNFVAINSTSSVNTCYVSSDGNSWQPVVLPASTAMYTECSSVNGKILIARRANPSFYITSTDGLTWDNPVNLPVSYYSTWTRTQYVKGTIIMTGYGTTFSLSSPDDGLSWDQKNYVTPANYMCNIYGGGKLIAVPSVDAGANFVASATI